MFDVPKSENTRGYLICNKVKDSIIETSFSIWAHVFITTHTNTKGSNVDPYPYSCILHVCCFQQV